MKWSNNIEFREFPSIHRIRKNSSQFHLRYIRWYLSISYFVFKDVHADIFISKIKKCFETNKNFFQDLAITCQKISYYFYWISTLETNFLFFLMGSISFYTVFFYIVSLGAYLQCKNRTRCCSIVCILICWPRKPN